MTRIKQIEGGYRKVYHKNAEVIFPDISWTINGEIEISPCTYAGALPAGRERNAGGWHIQQRHPAGSDEAPVDVAPSPVRSRLQASDHRVVGLLVVRSGVVVRRVIGAGDPAAGQADDESRRAPRAVLAVPAVI
jgi:hypothetical protein